MTLKIPSCYRLLIGLAFFLSAVVCLPASAGDQPVKQCPPAAAGAPTYCRPPHVRERKPLAWRLPRLRQ
jgi:hypothetical protein